MVSKEPKWNALCMFHFLVTRTYQTIFLGRATHSANKLLNKWILQIIQNLQGTLRTTNIKPVDTLIPWSNQKIEHNFSHQKVPCLSLLHVSWAEKWRHSYSSTTCGRPPAIANSNLNWFRLLTTKSKAWKHVRSRAGLDVYFTFLQQREDWMRWRFFHEISIEAWLVPIFYLLCATGRLLELASMQRNTYFGLFRANIHAISCFPMGVSADLAAPDSYNPKQQFLIPK